MYALYLLSLVVASLRRYALFDLVVSITALLGVGWLGGSFLRKFYPPSSTAGLCPRIFIFPVCLVWQFEYLLSLSSHPCPIWKIYRGLRSLTEGPIGDLLCARFLDGFQGVWCILSYPHPKSLPLLVGFLFLPWVCWRVSIKSENRKMGFPQNNNVRGRIINESDRC